MSSRTGLSSLAIFSLSKESGFGFMIVLVGFNWVQLSGDLRRLEMRILAQSLQLFESAMDQKR
jgi:hypothetical protein